MESNCEMNCDKCVQHNPAPVSYLVHESIMVQQERTIRRLWILCLVLIIALIGTNLAWTVYENGFTDHTAIDSYLWSVQRYLMQRYGTRTAEADTDPLRWYILTGRASADFLLQLEQAKPYLIARKLHMGGSYDEAIDRVKKYLGM